jgi:hypothetical protein
MAGGAVKRCVAAGETCGACRSGFVQHSSGGAAQVNQNFICNVDQETKVLSVCSGLDICYCEAGCFQLGG